MSKPVVASTIAKCLPENGRTIDVASSCSSGVKYSLISVSWRDKVTGQLTHSLKFNYGAGQLASSIWKPAFKPSSGTTPLIVF